MYFLIFLEGIMSFFSPCILPLLPVYLGYLSGSEDKSRKNTFKMTLGFCLGIATLFFFFAFASSGLSTLFKNNQPIFQLITGLLLIFIAGIHFGIISIQLPGLSKIHEKLQSILKSKVTFLKSFLFGFLITITWSPCIGPLLGTSIVQAASSGTRLQAFLLICCYTLGFIFIFILLGLFTEELLNFIRKHRDITRYVKIISGLLILGMGFYLVYQGLTNSKLVTSGRTNPECCGIVAVDGDRELTATDYNFTLKDMNNNTISLTDYVGKPILVSFSATWCTYCNMEWPHFSELAESGDATVIVITKPNYDRELDEAGIKKYMEDRGYKFIVAYDNDLSVSSTYGVIGYPTTFFLDSNGDLITYVPGYVDESTLSDILQFVETKDESLLPTN